MRFNLILLLFLLFSVSGQQCSRKTGPCQYCQSSVQTTTPNLIRISYRLELNVQVPPIAGDFSVSINSQSKTVTNAVFIDAKTIELKISENVGQEELVTWSYTQNPTESLRLQSKAYKTECNSQVHVPVQNEVNSLVVMEAIVDDLEPSTIEVIYSSNLKQTVPLDPSTFKVLVRLPPNDLTATHTVTTATYYELDKIKLVFGGEPVLRYEQVVSIVYTGTNVESSDGVKASQLKTHGLLDDGFYVTNRVLSPSIKFTASVRCRPSPKTISLSLSEEYKPMEPNVLLATSSNFAIHKIKDLTDEIEKTYTPTNVEANSTSQSQIYLTIAEDVVAKSLGYRYEIEYTRPARNSNRQFKMNNGPQVAGSQRLNISNAVTLTEPTIESAALEVEDYDVQYLFLEFTKPLDPNSPQISKNNDDAWKIFTKKEGGDYAKVIHTVFCPYPQTCMKLYLDHKNIDNKLKTLYITYDPTPTHRYEHLYDICGNQVKAWDMFHVQNLLPSTTGTTIAPNTPSGSTGDDNGDSRIATPSIHPGGSDNFVLWVIGGSIIGLISGCCCVCICFAPCSNKGTRQNKGRFGPGGKSRFKDRGKRNKGRFNSFKDESLSDEDDDDVNILKMAPISSDVVGTNDGEFDDFEHEEAYIDDF